MGTTTTTKRRACRTPWHRQKLDKMRVHPGPAHPSPFAAAIDVTGHPSTPPHKGRPPPRRGQPTPRDVHARVADLAKQARLDTLPPRRVVRVGGGQRRARRRRVGAETHQLRVRATVEVPRHHLRTVGGRPARRSRPPLIDKHSSRRQGRPPPIPRPIRPDPTQFRSQEGRQAGHPPHRSGSR